MSLAIRCLLLIIFYNALCKNLALSYSFLCIKCLHNHAHDRNFPKHRRKFTKIIIRRSTWLYSPFFLNLRRFCCEKDEFLIINRWCLHNIDCSPICKFILAGHLSVLWCVSLHLITFSMLTGNPRNKMRRLTHLSPVDLLVLFRRIPDWCFFFFPDFPEVFLLFTQILTLTTCSVSYENDYFPYVYPRNRIK